MANGSGGRLACGLGPAGPAPFVVSSLAQIRGSVKPPTDKGMGIGESRGILTLWVKGSQGESPPMNQSEHGRPDPSSISAESIASQIRAQDLTVSKQDAAWDEGWSRGCRALDMTRPIKI